MTIKKPHFNWYSVLAGALMLYFGIPAYNRTEPVQSTTRLSVELSTDVINVGGRREYRVKNTMSTWSRL